MILLQKAGAEIIFRGQFQDRINDKEKPDALTDIRFSDGAYEIRTRDLLHAMETRSQLR